MPDENVNVRFNVTNAGEAAKEIHEVADAQERVSASAEKAGESHTHFSHKVRGAAHVVTGTVGRMAGAIDPEFGKIVGSIGMGAHMFRYFGAQVAIAVTVLEAVSTVIEHYIKKQKEAEDHQLKMNKALRDWDLSAAHGELAKVNEELERFNLQGEQVMKSQEKMGTTIGGFWAAPINSIKMMFTSEKELDDRRREAAELSKRLFKEGGEARKVELEVSQAQLKTAQASAALDLDRAGTIGEIVSAMQKQQEATRAQVKIEQELADIEEMRRIKKLQNEGAVDEAAARMKARNAKLAAQSDTDALKEETDKRVIEKRILKFQEEMGADSLRAQKTYTDARMTVLKNEELEELRLAEEFSSTEGELAVNTERAKEDAVRRGVDIRVDAIEKEMTFWKLLGASYPQNVEVQREVNGKMSELANQRVSIEQEANARIIEDRKAMIEKLKQQEAEKASIGAGLEEKAVASLKKQGIAQITSAQVKAEATRLMAWGEYYAKQYDIGQGLSAEQLAFAKEYQGAAAGLRKTGLTTGGGVGTAVGLAEQERGAAYGFRVSPQDMVSSYAGGLGTDIKETFKGVETQVKASLENIKGMLSGAELGGNNLANSIADMLIRKLEFEAARQ